MDPTSDDSIATSDSTRVNRSPKKRRSTSEDITQENRGENIHNIQTTGRVLSSHATASHTVGATPDIAAVSSPTTDNVAFHAQRQINVAQPLPPSTNARMGLAPPGNIRESPPSPGRTLLGIHASVPPASRSPSRSARARKYSRSGGRSSPPIGQQHTEHIRQSSNSLSSHQPSAQPPASTAQPAVPHGHSPVSQSRSSSRLKRMQQHLIKLSEDEQNEQNRRRLATDAKNEIQRVQQTLIGASSTRPITGTHLQAPTPGASANAPSSSGERSSGESHSTPSHSASVHAATKDALVKFYAPKKQPTKQSSQGISGDEFLSPIEDNDRPDQALVSVGSTVALRNDPSEYPLSTRQPTAANVHSITSGIKSQMEYPTNQPPNGKMDDSSAKQEVDLIQRNLIERASKLKKILLVFCILALTFIAITAALSFQQISSVKSSLKEFRYSENVANYTSSMLESLLNGETGVRGYQITGDPSYLEPFNNSLDSTPLYYGLLGEITQGTNNEDILSSLSSLIDDIYAQWDITIRHRQTPGPSGFLNSRNDTLTLKGKETMDSIRLILSDLRAQESAIVSEKYSDSLDALSFMTITTAVTLSLIALLVCLGGAIGYDADNKGLQKHNQQLSLLLVKAEEATKLKSVFLANMSHEIRTPMNGVLAMTKYLCSMPELTQEQQEVLDTVLTSAESMMRLIDDLLLFSKMEAGKFRLCPINFTLNSLLKPLDEMFSIRCATKPPPPGVAPTIDPTTGLAVPPVKWCMILDENLPQRIFADNDRIRQVLTNLCDNAVKFTAAGTVTLKVSLVNPHSTRTRRRQQQPQQNPQQQLQATVPGSAGSSPGQDGTTGGMNQRQLSLEQKQVSGGAVGGGIEEEHKTVSNEKQSLLGTPVGPSIHASPHISVRGLSQGDRSPTPKFGSYRLSPIESSAQPSAGGGGDHTNAATVGPPPSLGFFQRILGASSAKLSTSKPKQSSTPSQTTNDTPAGSPNMGNRRLGGGAPRNGKGGPSEVQFSTLNSNTQPAKLFSTGADSNAGVTPKTMVGRGLHESRTEPIVPSNVPTQFVYLRFSVSDTGVGVDPSAHKAIFEPFQQADMSTTRNFGGTGLGLSICAQLVAQMGGRLKIQSSLGAGATFYFSIKCPVVYDQHEEEFDEASEDSYLTEEPETLEAAEDEYQRAGDEREKLERQQQQSHERAKSMPPESTAAARLRANDSSNSSEGDVIITFHDVPEGGGGEAKADIQYIIDPSASPPHHSPTDSSHTALSHLIVTSPGLTQQYRSFNSSDSAEIDTDSTVTIGPHDSLGSSTERPPRVGLPLSQRRNMATGAMQLNVPPPPTGSTAATPTATTELSALSSPKLLESSPSTSGSSTVGSPPGAFDAPSIMSPLSAPVVATQKSSRRTTAPLTSRHTKDASSAPNVSGGQPATAKESSVPSLHILIAEDNQINVKVLTKLLTREGHTVTIANNGLEAVEMYRAQPALYQLIFMDLHMPVMDGLAATTEIRAVEKEWNKALEQNSTPSGTSASVSGGGSVGGSGQHIPAGLVSLLSGISTKLPPGLPKQPKSPAAFAVGGSGPSPPESKSSHQSSTSTPSSEVKLVNGSPPAVASAVQGSQVILSSVSSSGSAGDGMGEGGSLLGITSALGGTGGPATGTPAALAAARKVHIPIIACTASAMDSDAEICKNVGMDDVLTKPVAINQLKEKLKSVAYRWQQQQRILRHAARHASTGIHAGMQSILVGSSVPSASSAAPSNIDVNHSTNRTPTHTTPTGDTPILEHRSTTA